MSTVLIPLTQGKFAIIDAEDEHIVSQYQWTAARRGNTWYAQSHTGHNFLYMHRLLLGLKRGGPVCDHINGDGLDNRRTNLRTCTHTQNLRNRRLQSNNTLGFKGIRPRSGRWQAHISLNRQQRFLGTFDTAVEAAQAYDRAASELFGEFARFNFPDERGEGT